MRQWSYRAESVREPRYSAGERTVAAASDRQTDRRAIIHEKRLRRQRRRLATGQLASARRASSDRSCRQDSCVFILFDNRRTVWPSPHISTAESGRRQLRSSTTNSAFVMRTWTQFGKRVRVWSKYLEPGSPHITLLSPRGPAACAPAVNTPSDSDRWVYGQHPALNHTQLALVLSSRLTEAVMRDKANDGVVHAI